MKPYHTPPSQPLPNQTIPNYKLSITNCHLQIVTYKQPITSFQLQIANWQLLIDQKTSQSHLNSHTSLTPENSILVIFYSCTSELCYTLCISHHCEFYSHYY